MVRGLLERITYYVGTFHVGRLYFPIVLCGSCNPEIMQLERGEYRMRFSTTDQMMAVVWQDNKLVSIVSTHPSHTIGAEGAIRRVKHHKVNPRGVHSSAGTEPLFVKRPDVIRDYNENMYGMYTIFCGRQ